MRLCLIEILPALYTRWVSMIHYIFYHRKSQTLAAMVRVVTYSDRRRWVGEPSHISGRIRALPATLLHSRVNEPASSSCQTCTTAFRVKFPRPDRQCSGTMLLREGGQDSRLLLGAYTVDAFLPRLCFSARPPTQRTHLPIVLHSIIAARRTLL